jgi:hypothetical protein
MILLTSYIEGAPEGNLFLLGIVEQTESMGCASSNTIHKQKNTYKK